MNNKIPTSSAYLLGFLMITVSLSTFVLGYKVISLHQHIFSAAALIIPFRYVLGDIIAEIYGFYLAKKFIWYGIFCGFIFSLICISVIKLPSPSYWNYDLEYHFVLGNTFKIACDATLGVALGSMLNIYLLSKWKVMLRGKWFWLRSLGSSVCGELTQYIVVLTMMYWHYFSAHKIIELIVIDYLVQVVILIMLLPFAQLAILLIKKIENIDVYDENITFNPFVCRNQD